MRMWPRSLLRLRAFECLHSNMAVRKDFITSVDISWKTSLKGKLTRLVRSIYYRRPEFPLLLSQSPTPSRPKPRISSVYSPPHHQTITTNDHNDQPHRRPPRANLPLRHLHRRTLLSHPQTLHKRPPSSTRHHHPHPRHRDPRTRPLLRAATPTAESAGSVKS